MSFFGIRNTGVGQTPFTVEVTTANTILLAANDARKWAVFTNTSNRTVWISIGENAEVDKGTPIEKGETFRLDAFALSVGIVHGITAVGTADVTGQEGL